MKTIISFAILLLSTYSFGQEVKIETIMHDGIERNYRLFIPSSYDGSPLPSSLTFMDLDPMPPSRNSIPI